MWIVRGRPTSTWTPRLLPNVRLWLDVSNESSIVLNGSSVSQWSDLSGDNNHAAQTTATDQPVLVTTGGPRRIVFSATDIP